MDEEPLVSVVRGTPTAAEVAALVAVLTSRSTDSDSHLPRAIDVGVDPQRPPGGRAGLVAGVRACPPEIIPDRCVSVGSRLSTGTGAGSMRLAVTD